MNITYSNYLFYIFIQKSFKNIIAGKKYKLKKYFLLVSKRICRLFEMPLQYVEVLMMSITIMLNIFIWIFMMCLPKWPTDQPTDRQKDFCYSKTLSGILCIFLKHKIEFPFILLEKLFLLYWNSFKWCFVILLTGNNLY